MPALAQTRLPPLALALATGAAAATVGAAAVLDPQLALAAIAGLVFAAVAFSNLALGVAAFAALSFFERVSTGAGEAVSLAKLTGIILIVAALRKSGAPLLTREHPVLGVTAVVLVAWAAASAVWAGQPGAALAEAAGLAFGVAVAFVVFAAARTLRDVRVIVWAYVAGAVASALVGFAQLSAGGQVGDAIDAGADANRLAGGVGDPNELAAFLLPALALAAFGLAAHRGLGARWLLIVALMVIVPALFLTQSRGGLLALAMMLVLGIALAGPVRAQVLALALAVGALGLGLYAVAAPPETRGRLANIAAGGGTGRVDLWSIAKEVALDHPLAGVGSGNFRFVEPLYSAESIALPNVELIVDRPRVVHNTFLEILAELGVTGALLFGLLISGTLAVGVRAWGSLRDRGDVTHELLTRALVVGTIGMLISFVFISGQAKEQLWIVLGLLLRLGSLSLARAE